MALSAVGIGLHTVFNLYLFALSMDGVRGAKVLIACLAAGSPAALACQAVLISWQGLTGGLVAFALTNLVLVAVVAATAARVYRARPSEVERGKSSTSSTSSRPTSPRGSAATSRRSPRT
jgi:hypothetical protein